MRNKRKSKQEQGRQGEKGAVLFFILAVTLVGMLIAGGILLSAMSTYRLAVVHLQISQGDWLAEAAVNRAIHQWEKDPEQWISYSNVPLGDGYYSLIVTPLEDNQVKLQSEGRIGSTIRRTLEVIYDKEKKQIISWKEG